MKKYIKQLISVPTIITASWLHDWHRARACRAEARLKTALNFPAEYGPADIADLRLMAHHALQRADRSLARLEAYRAWRPWA